ncbi:hypothetical protein CEXT_757871 [Caerostris extrusa]|uniref:Uncharacterized protein n=1 Tax=Caerostris extrusa TaxID=172846 RepID=A0AAV4P9D1_CAEEX|nr:hypothetical protein CEXT_757871 [Caerostris extrusa]
MWVRLRSSRNPFPTHMSVVGVTSVYFCANVTEPSTCLVNKRHRLHPIKRLLTPLRHLPPGPIITAAAALTSLNVTTRPCRAHSSISLSYLTPATCLPSQTARPIPRLVKRTRPTKLWHHHDAETTFVSDWK